MVLSDQSAVTAAGRSPLPALMQQFALLTVAGAAATGAGSASVGSRALQAAGGQQAAELDAHDPGLQPVLQLLHLDSGLLPSLLAALGNLPTSHPADSVTAAAPAQPSALPTLPAAAEAAAGGPRGSRDEAALQEATGALSVLAAVLAESSMRPAVLEAERPVQRLIDATVQVCPRVLCCMRFAWPHLVCIRPENVCIRITRLSCSGNFTCMLQKLCKVGASTAGDGGAGCWHTGWGSAPAATEDHSEQRGRVVWSHSSCLRHAQTAGEHLYVSYRLHMYNRL